MARRGAACHPKIWAAKGRQEQGGVKRHGLSKPSKHEGGASLPRWVGCAPFSPGCQFRSADRRSVLQAALVPELVQPAGKAQRRLQADIALEAFAVIADILDDVVGPV